MKNELEISLANSFAGSDLSAAANIAEVGLDAVLNEGVLREIPILGTIVGVSRAGGAIRDRIYLKKVARFLTALSTAGELERESFMKNLGDQDSRIRFSESVLMLIERADDIRKADLIGYLWASCARDEIKYSDAVRLCYMVNRAFYTDLEFLQNMKFGVQGEDTPIAEALFSSGLVSDFGFCGGNFSDRLSAGTRFGRNKYGDMLVEFGLNQNA